MPDRVRAWELHREQGTSRVHWIPDGMNLAAPRDADGLGLLAVDLGASVVVVDSARAAGAGDESTRDMSLFVRGLETVQRRFGGLLLVAHNSGRDVSLMKRARLPRRPLCR